MRLRTQIELLRSYFLDKNKIGHIVFYILGASFIVYAYNFKTLLLLILFVFSIFACSIFLVELYLLIKGRLQTKKDFIITLVLLAIVVSLSFMFLSLKVVLYILILSIVVTAVSIYMVK